MNTRRTSRTTAIVLAGAIAVAFFAGATAAQATDTGWVIESFDARVTVDADGTAHVVEDIAVDFAGLQRHGIFRVIPAHYEVGSLEADYVPEGRDPGDFVRAVDITDVEVTSTAPADLEITSPNRFGEHNLQIRIGDPDVTVTGQQHYEIRYTVHGAIDAFAEVDELNWNITGNDWPVPIERAAATVSGPGLVQASCYRGPEGSTEQCEDAPAEEGNASFAAGPLAPGEGMTVASGFEKGAIAVEPPRLVEQWRLGRSLSGSPLAYPLAGLTLLLGLGGVGVLAYRQGRDRITRGGMTVDGQPDAVPERRSLFSPHPVVVQYRPPEGLRPGQLGVIIDERVDPVDVSATIVDLAVRGYLTIEERDRALRRQDWTLRRTDKRVKGLLPYERTLLAGLFENRKAVHLSQLKGKFSTTYEAAKRDLYDDAVERGWFTRSPTTTRTTWLVIGLVATTLAAGLFIAAVLFTTVALAVLPLVLAALALTVAYRWMPHRTPTGSRTLVGTLGFREFISAAETHRMEFAEQENLFETYLPYAIVFGAVDKWAAAFSGLGAAAATGVGMWYIGHGHDGFRDLNSLSQGLSSFSHSVSSTLPQAPPSSGGSGGGGSSGGGHGGGGGGSW